MEFTRQSLREPIDALVQAERALLASSTALEEHGASRLGSVVGQLAESIHAAREVLETENARLTFRAGAIPDAGRRRPRD